MQQLQTTSGIDVGISQSFSPNANFDPEVPCAPGGSSHTMSKANPRSIVTVDHSIEGVAAA
jgi:hypothetical protein